MRGSRRELTFEFVFFGLSIAATQGSRFATFAVAMRLTSPDEFGVWNALQLILIYGVVAMLGIPNGMARQVPLMLGRGRAEDAIEAEVSSFWVTAGLLGGVAALLALAAGVGPIGERYRASLLALAALFPAWHGYQYLQLRLKSRLQFNLVSLQNVLFSLLLPAVTLPAVARWRVPGFIAGQAAAAIVMCVFIHKAGRMRMKWPTDWRLVREMTMVGLPIMVAGLVYAGLISVDRLLVLRFLGTEALGAYTLPILCVTAINLLPSIVSQQMYPRMVYAYGERSSARALLPLAVKQSLVSGALVLPIVVVLGLLLPTLAEGFLPEYAAGVQPARILLIGLGAAAFSGGAGNLLNTVGQQLAYVAVLVGAAVCAVAMVSTLLILRPGLTSAATGAAGAYVLFTVAVNAVAWWIARREATR